RSATPRRSANARLNRPPLPGCVRVASSYASAILSGMYFKTARRVLDAAIPSYAAANGISEADVLKEVAEHLETMAREHQEDDPSIPYEHPLCRLGYIYKHLGANATVFERAILKNPHVDQVLRSRAGKRLRVCAVGGGPGSELLGLTKFLV